MLSDDELWKALEMLHRNDSEILSLTTRSSHRIVGVSPSSDAYTIKFTDGDEDKVEFWKVSKMYSMLCENGRLFNSDMKKDGYLEIDMTEWHAPGSAMLAILPYLDFRITVHEGSNEAGLYRKISKPKD
jgi:hypothetical protein